MRFAVRHGLLRVMLPALAVLGVAASPASASSTAIVGHGYVNDNTTAQNTIARPGANGRLVAIHGSLVYVANAGAGDSNYTGFRLGHDGRLRPIAHSTFALPAGSQPGDVLFNGSGTVLAGTRVASSQIDSFRVRRDGRLVTAPGSPFAAQGPGPFGSEFRPPTRASCSSQTRTAALAPAPYRHSGSLRTGR